eukprot:gene9273-1786_t
MARAPRLAVLCCAPAACKGAPQAVPAELAWLHSELKTECHIGVHAEHYSAGRWASACPTLQPFKSIVDAALRGVYWHKDDPADFYGE